MGMGIDEQLGGYSRHRAAFTKGGSEMLAAEIKMDIGRISERNLGRAMMRQVKGYKRG